MAEQTAIAFRRAWEWSVDHSEAFDPSVYENWRRVRAYPFQPPGQRAHELEPGAATPVEPTPVERPHGDDLAAAVAGLFGRNDISESEVADVCNARFGVTQERARLLLKRLGSVNVAIAFIDATTESQEVVWPAPGSRLDL